MVNASIQGRRLCFGAVASGCSQTGFFPILITGEAWEGYLGLLVNTALQRGDTAPCRNIKLDKVSANLRKIYFMQIKI